jgi:chemotaxis protein MotB
MAGKGGAWKVAYADFVTAMMALFMVLWICAQDEKILDATARYFQNPFTSNVDGKNGILKFESNRPSRDAAQSKKMNGPSSMESSSARSIDLNFLNSVAKDFFRLLNLDEAMANKPIDVQVTSDGLRVTLYDRAKQPLFAGKTADFTPWGDFVMQSLAWMIDRNGFDVVIEGHTRAGLEFQESFYGPWELSADRANSARRAIVRYAVDAKAIERVSGYGDTLPLAQIPPDSESNQRVTLSLRLGKKASVPPSSREP